MSTPLRIAVLGLTHDHIWGNLAELSVEGEDGTLRSATHADVTHLRWTLASVAPGESGKLEYSAIIR